MNKATNYWKTAEIMNGRLAMMGLLAAVVNYGFTGWIIPGFVQTFLFIKMTLSYWLRAEVDDLLNEDTFFDSSDYSCLLEDTEWSQKLVVCLDDVFKNTLLSIM